MMHLLLTLSETLEMRFKSICVWVQEEDIVSQDEGYMTIILGIRIGMIKNTNMRKWKI